VYVRVGEAMARRVNHRRKREVWMGGVLAGGKGRTRTFYLSGVSPKRKPITSDVVLRQGTQACTFVVRLIILLVTWRRPL